MKIRKLILKSSSPSGVSERQAFFWTRRWQEGEKKASSDIQSGRVRRYDSPEKLFSHLDRRRKK